MKKILVLGVKSPFALGGQEILVNTLVEKLKQRGYQADKVELPFSPIPRDKILSQAALWRSLDLSDPDCSGADLVIATKFPSYYINHPNKVVWLVHQQRSIYDLYGSRYSDFTDSPLDEAQRNLILEADKKTLAEAKSIYCISDNVSKRLKQFCDTESEVLYPPLPASGMYKSNPSEDFILYAGRINSIKRVELIIRAMPNIIPNIKLKIAGKFENSSDERFIKNEIKNLAPDRVEILGKIPLEDLMDNFSKAKAVFYAPLDEDYGFVSLEAMACSKPVISCNDSGGILEFVKDGQTGIVTNPDPHEIGEAVNLLATDDSMREKFGKNARALIEKHNLDDQSWDGVINGLLKTL